MKTFFVDRNFNSSLNTPRYVQDPVSATADFVSPTLREHLLIYSKMTTLGPLAIRTTRILSNEGSIKSYVHFILSGHLFQLALPKSSDRPRFKLEIFDLLR